MKLPFVTLQIKNGINYSKYGNNLNFFKVAIK